MFKTKLEYFFDCCVGKWVAERTYHDMRNMEVERSQTKFQIEVLPTEGKVKVLEQNKQAINQHIEKLWGYHLAFDTVSAKGQGVSQSLNMLFVPTREDELIVEGDYLRDRAYEEAKPIVANFRFYTSNLELLMTTYYTRIVSVDSIALINPNLRIRKIVNYERPPEGQALKNVALVGFGVEQKAALG